MSLCAHLQYSPRDSTEVPTPMSPASSSPLSENPHLTGIKRCTVTVQSVMLAAAKATNAVQAAHNFNAALYLPRIGNSSSCGSIGEGDDGTPCTPEGFWDFAQGSAAVYYYQLSLGLFTIVISSLLWLQCAVCGQDRSCDFILKHPLFETLQAIGREATLNSNSQSASNCLRTRVNSSHQMTSCRHRSLLSSSSKWSERSVIRSQTTMLPLQLQSGSALSVSTCYNHPRPRPALIIHMCPVVVCGFQ